MRSITTSRVLLSGALALGALGAVAVFGVAPATADPAPDVSMTVYDPVGDTLNNTKAEFQDVVRARLTKTACGDFKLLMEMAVPVPVAPTLPSHGKSEIWWMWAFDLGSTPVPRGYPWQEAGSDNKFGRPAEFIVYVSWDGTTFAGTAIDRRPLLTGGEPIVTPVPFSIDGKIIEADLASAVIGEIPAGFGWGPYVGSWSGQVGTEAFHWADYFEAGFAVFNP
jgi:hypothetical protein